MIQRDVFDIAVGDLLYMPTPADSPPIGARPYPVTGPAEQHADGSIWIQVDHTAMPLADNPKPMWIEPANSYTEVHSNA